MTERQRRIVVRILRELMTAQPEERTDVLAWVCDAYIRLPELHALIRVKTTTERKERDT